jgi:hypothetical protein
VRLYSFYRILTLNRENALLLRERQLEQREQALRVREQAVEQLETRYLHWNRLYGDPQNKASPRAQVENDFSLQHPTMVTNENTPCAYISDSYLNASSQTSVLTGTSIVTNTSDPSLQQSSRISEVDVIAEWNPATQLSIDFGSPRPRLPLPDLCVTPQRKNQQQQQQQRRCLSSPLAKRTLIDRQADSMVTSNSREILSDLSRMAISNHFLSPQKTYTR